MRGSREMGAPSMRRLSDSGPSNIARSPIPSNLREIVQWSTGHRLSRHGLRDVAGVPSARLVYGAIAQEGEEDPGEPARERDHGDPLAAAGGNAAGPLAQGRRPGIAQPEHRDSGLDEQPPHPGRTRFGDPPPALGLPRAQLAGDEPQVGLDLVGAVEARGL